MGSPDLQLEWVRPLGLLLLAWWIPLWIFLRRKDRPLSLAVGTLDIWREVGASGNEQATRRSPRIPPRAWLWLLGIFAGALAVTGPAWNAQPTLRLQRVFVDRSPSMFLPFEAGSTRTRYDLALERVLANFEERGIPEDAREWQTAGQSGVRAAVPPAEWSRAPRAAVAELDAAVLQRADLHVMTDRARESRGALFASGGAAIPGLVGEWQGVALNWDGVRVREGQDLEPQRVALDGALPAPLAQLFVIWARERGLALGEHTVDPALVLRVPQVAPARTVRATHEGWNVIGESVALAEAQTVLIRDEQGRALLSSPRPGLLECGLRSVQTLDGDPAAWAVSWARLFDGALLPRAALVPLTERRTAGQGLSRGGHPTPAETGESPLPPAAWLALFALLAALGAFFPRTLPGAI